MTDSLFFFLSSFLFVWWKENRAARMRESLNICGRSKKWPSLFFPVNILASCLAHTDREQPLPTHIKHMERQGHQISCVKMCPTADYAHVLKISVNVCWNMNRHWGLRPVIMWCCGFSASFRPQAAVVDAQSDCVPAVKCLCLILCCCFSPFILATVAVLVHRASDGCSRVFILVRLEFSSFWLWAWQSVVISMTGSWSPGVPRRTHTRCHTYMHTYTHTHTYTNPPSLSPFSTYLPCSVSFSFHLPLEYNNPFSPPSPSWCNLSG